MKSCNHWTKDELRLKHGVYDLAKDVIKQWNLDGRPQCDKESVDIWKELLISHARIETYSCQGINVDYI